jgi:protoporphyrin/coproporphyrin ferrochelatase
MWTVASMQSEPDATRPDAFLLLSFGGPEGPDDVMPFLRNVTRGRGVPEARLAEVAEHYQHFGGVSPINGQNRLLLEAIGADFAAHGVDLPLYWGNRNWHPMLADTVARMRDDGVRHAVAFVTSAFGSYSSCRQYLEDIAAARAAVGPDAPVVQKLRHHHDHPGYVRPLADGVRAALSTVDATDARLIFTGHSVPLSAARAAGPDGGRYCAQLRETARLVAAAAAPGLEWDLVWQSRSGPPHVPWLEPDINDHLATVATTGVRSVVVSPIGFSSDHLEVVWDLDTEAAATAAKLGLEFARAATPGTDPRYVAMVRELIVERYDAGPKRKLGTLPVWDACPEHCCLPAGTSREAA